MARFDTITFLSDFGLADEFVGVVHRVIRRMAPEVGVVDLTHELPAHDVRSGALVLWRTARWLTPGVVMAVVDPGVGTARRGVAVEAFEGSLVLVGPDNGLLTPAAHLAGAPTRAVSLTDPAWHLPAGDPPLGAWPPAGERAVAGLPPVAGDRPGAVAEREADRGATFDGRDVFAPVAAHLCAGVDLAELGELFDPADLVGRPLTLASGEPAEVVASGLEVEVLWVDRYGNAQLGVRPAAIEVLGSLVLVTRAEDRATPASANSASATGLAIRARAYGDLAAGQLGLVTDSAGLVALCLDGASAAAALGLRAGSWVHLGLAAGA